MTGFMIQLFMVFCITDSDLDSQAEEVGSVISTMKIFMSSVFHQSGGGILGPNEVQYTFQYKTVGLMCMLPMVMQVSALISYQMC